MSVDWDQLTEFLRPKPDYKTLIEQIQKILSYNIIQVNYNHEPDQAIDYAKKILETLAHPKRKYNERIIIFTKVFQEINRLGVKNYNKLVDRLQTKTDFERFVAKTKLEPHEVIQTLKYLYYWVFPNKIYLSRFIEKEKKHEQEYIKTLRRHGVRFSLDILEYSSQDSRKKLSNQTGVPFEFIERLTNYSDLTRIPFINAKTVQHFTNAGYDTIKKISETNIEVFEKEVKDSLEKRGIKDSRLFIEPEAANVIAKALPKIFDS
jgi:hypothetical protein